jgi:hypothetical protein
VRTEVVKRRVGPALYQVMEPGDQIIAGTLAMSGYSPAWDVLAALPSVAGGIAGVVGLFSNYAASPGPSVAGLGLGTFLLSSVQLRRRPVFLAVTQQQFICYRLSKVGNEPTRLLFRAPLASVRMASPGSWAPRWRSVRYSGPGAGDRGLRLNVHGHWRKDFDEVLAALHASGAAVDGVPRAGLPADPSRRTHPTGRPLPPAWR